MRHRKGFTLIELLVVIAIIALLLAILMPALQRVKKQARAVGCQANLRQWGFFFSLYMDDNNGFFTYGDASGQWRNVLESNKDRKLSVYCPEAVKQRDVRDAFSPWGVNSKQDDDYIASSVDGGSYGINRWVYNRKPGASYAISRPNEFFWKGRNVKGTDRVPLFQDCTWYGKAPLDIDIPPQYNGNILSDDEAWETDNMRAVCLNRHNGATNILFLDISVRKIGLKELWTLKWNTQFKTNNIWTKAGGALPEHWPEWMRNFKDY
ncbi:MAG: prepilin-type N-terminal cleavage/methylation domain-containing protein [Sedimentisphaerales bacterium]|nr:prepilin-type N-terminal cleavage/methylation domain-containing protein [Sedimentisphaerales bacterium]